MNQSRTENTIRNSAAAMLLQIVSILTRFLTQTIFIYTLGKQYTGVSGVFSDLLLMMSGAELGIGAAVLFALYQPVSEQNEEKIRAYAELLKKVYRIVAFAVGLIGVVLLPLLPVIIKDVPDIKESIRLIFFLFVIKSACSYLYSYHGTLFAAYQQKRVVSFLSCGTTVLTAVAQIFVLLLTGNYLWFLVLDIMGVLLRNVCVAAALHKKHPELFRKEKTVLSKAERSSVWHNVWALSLYRFSRIVLDGTDSVIISAILGTPLVSLLFGYRMIINYITDFAGLFFHSAQPSVGNAIATESTEHNFKLFHRMTFALFAITCVTGTCLFVMLTPFIHLWLGAEYCFSFPIVAALVLNYYTSMMMIMNTTFRNGYGLYTKGVFSPAIMAGLNIILSLLAAKPFGVAGILAVTSISRLATQLWVDPVLLYRYAFGRKLGGYFRKFAGRLVVMSFCCAVSFIITRQLPYGYGTLIIRFLVAVTVSMGTIWLLYRRKEEFCYVADVIKKIGKRIVKK